MRQAGSSLAGCIDGYDAQGKVTGWVVDPDQPSDVVTVQLLYPGREAVETKACILRNDLNWMSNRNVGFKFEIDELIDPQRIVSGEIKVIAKGVALKPIKMMSEMGKSHRFWTREVMDRTTSEWMSAFDTKNSTALEISGRRWSKLCFWKSYEVVEWPEFDICRDTLSKTFDFVIAEQVWEHLRYPHRAVKNVYSMLKEGGRFLLTTPFLIHIHAVPSDYTRWTEDGLKYMLEEGGFDPKKCRTASWGNINCVVNDLLDNEKKLGWRNYDQTTQSLDNNTRFPTCVWALAEK